MRSVDWADTPLGATAAWPQSLRTALSILQDSKFPMYIAWGPEYVQLYNDGYRPILGSTKHPAAMGRRAAETFAESWHIIGPMFDGVRAGEAFGAEDWMLPLDRHGYLEECYFTFSYSPIRDETGGVGGVLVTVTETTDRVVGARRLRALHALSMLAGNIDTAEKACEEAARALALDEADVPFALLYLFSDDGTARLAASFGVAAERLAPVASLDAHDPFLTSGATVAGRLGEIRLGAWAEPVKETVATPMLRPGGLPAYGVLVAGVSPARRVDEAYEQFFSLVSGHVATAITSVRALEEERRRTAALAEVDRAKSAFFSNVSHEFRTPLTLMLGPLEDAVGSPAHALGGPELDTTYRNALRLSKLVNVLLDFSRIEAGTATPNREPTDLRELTVDLASAFRAAIERANLRLEVRCNQLSRPVQIDRDMWERVVLNLLSNALKFTMEGSIKVGLDEENDRARLTVEDTGAGIPAEELPRLFERFHRVPGARSRTHEGSGIGLALVHELVRLHQGTIDVTSTVGRGTTFIVTIPFGDAAAATSSPAAPARAAKPFVEEAVRWVPDDEERSVSPSGRTTRVLVADDNSDMRDYLRRTLEARFEVETVPDGEAALAAIARQRPDVVLTDVMMPKMDGFELLRRIRSDPATALLPVVILSARAGDEARVGGLEAGADDYLVKPFSGNELLARVTTQVALGRARAEARGANERLRNLFLQAPLAISVVTGPDFRYELANEPYERLVGRTGLAGKTMAEAFPELSADAPVYQMLRTIRETGQPFSAAEYPVRLERGDGPQDVYFQFVSQPIREPDGRIETILTAAIEVTEQVALRQRTERLRAAAEAANQAKDDFLAVLGHELRNPLAPIVTGLQLMKMRAPLDRERSIIERQVAHMVRLVDDLLDVSRIVRGKVTLTRTRLELSEPIAHALETVSPLLAERRHRLDVDVSSLGLAVEGDASRLSQIFANLVTNACKYTAEGGRIRVAARRDGDSVVVSVADNGLGLAPEMTTSVFESFVQAPQGRDRARGGLGLGLAIVRGLVALHEGTTWATSDGVGKGSTFYVRLPLAGGADASAEPSSIPADAPHSRGRVLIVDDNEDAAELLMTALEATGYTVHVAHHAEEALAALGRMPFDVGVFDIGLPSIDGYELARRVRADERFRQLPLIALTGYGQASDVKNAENAGFSKHLVKPVDLDKLEAALRAALSARS